MNVSPSPVNPDPAAALRTKLVPSKGATIWPALALLLLVGIYRIGLAWETTHSASGGGVFSWLPGFCPLAALTLCGGWFLPRRLALVAPLVVLGLTDLALTAIYGWQPMGGGDGTATVVQMVSRYVVLLLLGAGALSLRSVLPKRPALRGLAVLAGTAVGSALFYGVTNTFSWLTLPGYSLTATGWWQALTTGLPGYPPSWIFFRNALVSDLLYACAMLVAVGAVRRSRISIPGNARSARPNVPAGAH